jgi:DNA-directed RNA polymerase specialized sigma24 family protein
MRTTAGPCAVDVDWEALSSDLHQRYPTDEDLVQDALIALWETLRLGKTVPNPEAWCRWRIRRRRIDAWRKDQTQQAALERYAAELKASGDDVYTHPGLLDKEQELEPPKVRRPRRRPKQAIAA